MDLSLEDVIELRDRFFDEQDRIYFNMINKINTKMKDLLNNGLANELTNNCIKNISSQIVMNYISLPNSSNKYITAEEMYNRIVNFSYEEDYDPLNNSYKNIDEEFMAIIAEESKNNQSKLFTEERSKDKLDIKGKKEYRNSKKDEFGNLYDEITGVKENKKVVIKNNKEVEVSDLHADHIQSREAATYNSLYIREEKVEELKKFYNSADNFQIMHSSANSSKSDVRVYDPKTGEDITYKATAEQLADATIERWERGFQNRDKGGTPLKDTLCEKGYAYKTVDRYGNVCYKVRKEVRDRLIENTKKSMNAESVVILQSTDYAKVGSRAFENTTKSFFDILTGQILYYGLPPILYEVRNIINNKNITLDTFFDTILNAFKRVIRYMNSKVENIISNISYNSFKTFIVSFFDILISILKATVNRIMNMIKDIIMAFVNSINILFDKQRTLAEKADAIFTTLGMTISSIVVNVIFEYIEIHCPWIKPFTEPIQIICTIITTNIVMIILQKMDIFNVRYGLVLKNIQEIFENGRAIYDKQLSELEDSTYSNIDIVMSEIESNIFDTMNNIYSLDIYNNDLKDEINKINKIFNMGIDLDTEWNYFTST